MGRSRKRKAVRAVVRLWGYVLVLVIAIAWTQRDVSPIFIIIGSCLSFLYMLFGAPTWCMAPTRDQLPCRNNAHGLLVGCWIHEHKWQKLRMLVRRQRWAELLGRFWSNTANSAAAIGALGTVLSATVATVTLVVK